MAEVLAKYVCFGFILGQILALCNAGTGVTSQLLTDKFKVSLIYVIFSC